MAYQFPHSPIVGDMFSPPGGPSWRWNGFNWAQIANQPGVTEAPVDGLEYVRKNAAWVQSSSAAPDWMSITGKPSTFPPDAHVHPQSDVTGLVTDLAGKEPTIAAGTGAQYWRGTKTWAALDKAAVGLANVDNTSDADAPVSTAQQTALDGKVNDTGDTMTGDLTISKTTPALIVAKGASGQEGLISFKTGANLRWNIASNVTVESANAGSDFTIRRYNDAGTLVDTPFTINRSSGGITAGAFFSATTYMAAGTTVGANSFIKAQSAGAPAAGGTANTGFIMFSTNILVTAGSGAPTLSAPKGSLYLRTDATTNVTRMYVNTDGATAWTAVNTVA